MERGQKFRCLVVSDSHVNALAFINGIHEIELMHTESFEEAISICKKKLITMPSTIMLGKKNDVIFAGSPILHSNLEPLYIKRINQFIGDKKKR